MLDREEVVVLGLFGGILGLFIAGTTLATLCLWCFLHISKAQVETELPSWGCPAHLQSLCWGQEESCRVWGAAPTRT